MDLRRPIAGGIALAAALLGLVVAVVATVIGYLESRDAFEPLVPWVETAGRIAVIPLLVAGLIALIAGIVGMARRETPRGPAVAGVALAIPMLGVVALLAVISLAVAYACAGPAGACGI